MDLMRVLLDQEVLVKKPQKARYKQHRVQIYELYEYNTDPTLSHELRANLDKVVLKLYRSKRPLEEKLRWEIFDSKKGQVEVLVIEEDGPIMKSAKDFVSSLSNRTTTKLRAVAFSYTATSPTIIISNLRSSKSNARAWIRKLIEIGRASCRERV